VDATLPWLDGLAGAIASIAIVLFVIVNGFFAANFLLRRDRHFVNRWTKPLVATDAVLLLAAVGTPVAVMAIKLAAKGVGLVLTATAWLFRGK
jgi:hypothetical protein